MRVTSTIPDFPAHAYRRIVVWCCRQFDLPARQLRLATLARSRGRLWGGLAHSTRRVGVRIRPERLADPLLTLVRITAHEIAHVYQGVEGSKTRRGGGWGGSEKTTEWFAWQLAVAFQENREQLMAEWFAPVVARPQRLVASIQERRADKTADMLTRWERKLKLAKTKVQAYRRKTNYYAKQAAKRNP